MLTTRWRGPIFRTKCASCRNKQFTRRVSSSSRATEDVLRRSVLEAVHKLYGSQISAQNWAPNNVIMRHRGREYDYKSTICATIAAQLGLNAREVAGAIAKEMQKLVGDMIAEVSYSSSHIMFRQTDQCLANQVLQQLAPKDLAHPYSKFTICVHPFLPILSVRGEHLRNLLLAQSLSSLQRHHDHDSKVLHTVFDTDYQTLSLIEYVQNHPNPEAITIEELLSYQQTAPTAAILSERYPCFITSPTREQQKARDFIKKLAQSHQMKVLSENGITPSQLEYTSEYTGDIEPIIDELSRKDLLFNTPEGLFTKSLGGLPWFPICKEKGIPTFEALLLAILRRRLQESDRQTIFFSSSNGQKLWNQLLQVCSAAGWGNTVKAIAVGRVQMPKHTDGTPLNLSEYTQIFVNDAGNAITAAKSMLLGLPQQFRAGYKYNFENVYAIRQLPEDIKFRVRRGEPERRAAAPEITVLEENTALVGRNSLSYYLITQHPNSQLNFNARVVFNLKGNTYLYIVTALIRLSAFWRFLASTEKAALVNLDPAEIKLTKQMVREERDLAICIQQLNTRLGLSLLEHSSSLTYELFHMVATFNMFFNRCRMIDVPEESLRVQLLLCTERTIRKTLRYLNVDPIIPVPKLIESLV